jgi:hypothetical protein
MLSFNFTNPAWLSLRLGQRRLEEPVYGGLVAGTTGVDIHELDIAGEQKSGTERHPDFR